MYDLRTLAALNAQAEEKERESSTVEAYNNGRSDGYEDGYGDGYVDGYGDKTHDIRRAGKFLCTLRLRLTLERFLSLELDDSIRLEASEAVRRLIRRAARAELLSTPGTVR